MVDRTCYAAYGRADSGSAIAAYGDINCGFNVQCVNVVCCGRYLCISARQRDGIFKGFKLGRTGCVSREYNIIADAIKAAGRDYKAACDGIYRTAGIGVQDAQHVNGRTSSNEGLRGIVVCVLCAFVMRVFQFRIATCQLQGDNVS